MGLLKRRVDEAEYQPNGPRQQILYDRDLPGFGLRLYPTGAMSFVVRYRNKSGRDRFLTIGKYGVVTLAQARKEAQRRLLDVKTGTDRVEKRKEARRGSTVAEFAEIYMDRHAKRHKASWTDDRKRIYRYVTPQLGPMKLKDVRRADVADLHSRIGVKAPGQANRVLALISVMFNRAVDWGFLDEDAPNPARRVQRFKENSRDRWIKPAELPRLMDSIEAEPNIYTRAALLLYLLTGLRRSELLKTRWEDIDLQRKEWRLPSTKAGRVHMVPLSAPAVEILRSLPRELNNPHVFPGRRKGHPLVNIAKPWDRIRKAADLEDVWIHDLRRTVGSWLAEDGNSLPLIGKILNHTNASTTQVYARFAEDAGRAALEQHGARLMDVARGGKR